MRSSYYFCTVGVFALTGLAGCSTDSSCQRTATCSAEATDAGNSSDTLARSSDGTETTDSSSIAAPEPNESDSTNGDASTGDSDELPVVVPTNPGSLVPSDADAGASGEAMNGTSPVAEDAGSIFADAGFVDSLMSDAGTTQDDAGSALPPSLFSVVVHISGLTGELVLSVNGEELQAHEDGDVVVAELENSSSYSVSVDVSPEDQACTVSNGEGAISGADVTDIEVRCANDITTLSTLTLGAVATVPTFAPDVLSYTAEVGLFVQQVHLEVTASDPQAGVSIAGVDGAASSDIPLTVGENNVQIVVTAPSGRTEAYALEVTRRETTTRREILAPDSSGVAGFANRVSVSGNHMFVDRTADDGMGPQAFLFQHLNNSWAYVTPVETLIETPLFTIIDGELCGDTLALVAQRTAAATTHELHLLRYDGSWAFDRTFNLAATVTDIACDTGTLALRSNVGTILYSDGADGFEFAQTLEVEPDTDSTGQRLSLDGNTLIIGDKNEDSGARGINGDSEYTCPDVNCAYSSGAAYIYERNPLGVWQRTAYLKGSNAWPDQLFGASVDISGDWAAVGAVGDASTFQGVDTSAREYSEVCAPWEEIACVYRSGAVFLYHREALGWAEAAYIKPTGIGRDHDAGSMVTLYGDLLVIGSKAGASGTGAAYLFSFAPDGWRQNPGTLVQAAPAMNDLFPRRGIVTERGFFGTVTNRAAGQDQVVWFE